MSAAPDLAYVFAPSHGWALVPLEPEDLTTAAATPLAWIARPICPWRRDAQGRWRPVSHTRGWRQVHGRWQRIEPRAPLLASPALVPLPQDVLDALVQHLADALVADLQDEGSAPLE